MAKFGLYESSVSKPMQEYEGEFLSVSGDNVSVHANDAKGTMHIVAVIHLAQGQSVKKVKE
jgi:hypothetical protein